MPRHTESDIQESYQGTQVAEAYVCQRFESELMALLHERQVAAVNSVMTRYSPARTLEIAPGPGRVTRDVVPAGELICLEFNEGMIEEGRAACGNDTIWQQGNAFELPFRAEFDFAYSFRFVRHFRREDRDRLYAEVHRALRDGGMFIMDAVNGIVAGPVRDAHPDGYPIYDKLYESEAKLRDELRQAGFEVVGLQAVQRWFPLQWRAQILLGPRSRWLCRTVIRTLERLRGGPPLEWIVTCRRV